MRSYYVGGVGMAENMTNHGGTASLERSSVPSAYGYDESAVENILAEIRILAVSVGARIREFRATELTEVALRLEELSGESAIDYHEIADIPDFLTSMTDHWQAEQLSWQRMMQRLVEHVIHADEVAKSQFADLRESNARLAEEIAGRELAEERLRFTADYDRLTHLPNRHVLMDRIEKCIAHRRRHQECIDAVMFLDLDNFKVINDSLGHSAGDELLVMIADRISHHRREQDFFSSAAEVVTSRLGGDEFVILVEELPSPNEAVKIAERLNGLMRDPFTVSGREVVVSSSIGIAIIDGRSPCAEDLLRNADAAMYQAKFSGKNRFALFDKEMHANAISRLELERDLRLAVQNGEFELHLQPIVALESMETEGYEALIRWRKDGELVPPGDFIDVAEETGLIVAMGRWVIEQACVTLGEWNRADPGGRKLAISVNVSKRQFLEENFTADVKGMIEAAKIEHSQLQVEVTESLVMANPEVITAKLRELRDFGVRIHMDDFGTGHSSLSCLHEFPIDVLKIDRSFIATMGDNEDYAAVVEAIIVLAHNLRTEVVAEGIETKEQLDQLKSLECDFGQGYLFAKPRPLAEVDWRQPVAACWGYERVEQ